MKLVANWSYPTAIKFGAGRVSELAEHCRAAGIQHPLLVTDRALADLPITARALDILEAGGLGRAMFSEVDPNPNEMNMEAGLAVYRAGGHDGVVCFGGGSALDLGKMIALMVDQPVSVWISRTWAIGGLAPTPIPSRQSSRCRRPPAPARRSGGPAF